MSLLSEAYLRMAESSVDYDEKINQFRNQAVLAKKMLLDTKSLNLEDERSNWVSILLMLFFYRTLYLFPDKDILDKFESLGMPKTHLKWFISIDELEAKFASSRRPKTILIFKDSVLDFISVYTSMRIINEIYVWAGMYKQDSRMNKISDYVTDLSTAERKRKNGSTTRRKMTTYKKTLHDYVVLLAAFDKKLGLKEGTLLKITKGQPVKSFLSRFVENSFYYSGGDFKHINFLSAIYDLCQLFLKDETMPTSDTVDERELYIGKTEEAWKAQVLRSILYGQRK